MPASTAPFLGEGVGAQICIPALEGQTLLIKVFSWVSKGPCCLYPHSAWQQEPVFDPMFHHLQFSPFKIFPGVHLSSALKENLSQAAQGAFLGSSSCPDCLLLVFLPNTDFFFLAMQNPHKQKTTPTLCGTLQAPLLVTYECYLHISLVTVKTYKC